MGWKNIIQGYKVVGESEVTKTFYVDANRTDDYIENGCIVKPFKTIQAAIAAASSDITINIAPGIYNGDIDMGSHVVHLIGSGEMITWLNGNITCGARTLNINNLSFQHGSLTITGTHTVTGEHLYINSPMTISGSATFVGNTLNINNVGNDVVPLTMNSTGECVIDGLILEAIGAANTIVQTAGRLVLRNMFILNNSVSHPTINSTGGICNLLQLLVANQGGGVAVSMENDGLASSPNQISNIVASGNISCGTAITAIGELNFIVFGALSGSALIYKPASRINNDSSVTGATVKDALEDIDTRISTFA